MGLCSTGGGYNIGRCPRRLRERLVATCAIGCSRTRRMHNVTRPLYTSERSVPGVGYNGILVNWNRHSVANKGKCQPWQKGWGKKEQHVDSCRLGEAERKRWYASRRLPLLKLTPFNGLLSLGSFETSFITVRLSSPVDRPSKRMRHANPNR